MNTELHFSKAEFILGSHQMKPCINITFMIAKSHILTCKMRESSLSINVFINKLIHWLFWLKNTIQKRTLPSKNITIWRDFIILLEENPPATASALLFFLCVCFFLSITCILCFLCASSRFFFYYDNLFVWKLYYSTNCKIHVYFQLLWKYNL